MSVEKRQTKLQANAEAIERLPEIWIAPQHVVWLQRRSNGGSEIALIGRYLAVAESAERIVDLMKAT